MRSILVILLATFSLSASAAFDRSAYEPISLKEASARMNVAPRANYYLDAAHSRYQSEGIYTGRSRSLTPELKEFIAIWVKSFGHPVSYAEMFPLEIQIKQQGQLYWLPIQDSLVESFTTEMKAGKKVQLYVLLMGARDHAPVFAISAFTAK